MTNSKDLQGDREPLLPHLPGDQDVFDQAIEEILGKDDPIAYSVFTAIERFVRQFRLTGVEPYELLFDAYLCGKKALQTSQTIRNPYGWLRGTAYNLARSKKRKRSQTCSLSPDLIDKLFHDHGGTPVDSAILQEEMNAARKAMVNLLQEDPEAFYLICQRVVEGLSWQEIQAQYGADYGGAEVPEATLRQRYSRGRKKLRKIFHTVMASR